MGILSSDKQLSSARGKGRCQPGQLLIFANIFHLSTLAPSTLPQQAPYGWKYEETLGAWIVDLQASLGIISDLFVGTTSWRI